MESGEVSAEVHFAQKLASNEKKIRDRAIKRLQKYLSVRSRHGVGLSDSDLLKIWKGLFYCMWMQDKPLIQEELSQRITSLLGCFPKTKDALQFVKVSLETHAREWNGIDKLRLDKFMMVVRDLLHKTFELLSKGEWQTEDCQYFANLITENVMDPEKSKLPDGLKLHLSDIFVEEMLRVSLSQMTSKKIVILLGPFIKFIVYSKKIDLVKRVMSDVIDKVINTMSADVDGSPKKTLQAPHEVDDDEENSDDEELMEAGSDEEGENEENIEMEQLAKFDLGLLLIVMFKLAGRRTVCGPNRKMIYKLVSKQQEMYDNAINTHNSSKLTSANEDPHNDADEMESERNGSISDKDLNFLLDDGKATDQQQLDKSRKKKKRKKMKKGKTEPEQVIETCISVDSDEHGKIKERKRKFFDDKALNCSSSMTSVSHLQKSDSAKHVRDNNLMESEDVSPLSKKLKLSSSFSESVLDTANWDSGADSKKSQKKKKLEKNKKESSLSMQSSPTAESVVQSTGKNTNSNARSKSRSASPPNQSPVTMPVELVVYRRSSATQLHSPTTSISLKEKKGSKSSSPLKHRKSTLPKEEKNFVTPVGHTHVEDMEISEDSLETSNMVDPNITSVQPNSDTSVPLFASSCPSDKNKKKGESPNKGKQSKKDSTDTNPNIVQEFCTALAGPCNIVKKAIAMVTPQPGFESFTHDRKRACSAELTPGTKKKVIFDLRRNKANKFQDYLKSIAQQPDSPHAPTKSPSASILKSPAPSPAPSTEHGDSAVDEESYASSESVTTSSSTASNKTRKRSLSKRRASAPNSSRGRLQSPHRKGKSKRSFSPKRQQSQSPTPTTGKQKSKQRGRAHK